MTRVNPLHRNLVIEAGAGSGKTQTLVDQIVGVVAEGRGTIDQIAAVTFTDAASIELRERIRPRLEQAADIKLTAAAVQLDSAYIGTIHGLARRIVMEHLSLLNLPSVTTVIDPATACSRHSEVMRAAARSLDRYADGGDFAMAFALGLRMNHLVALVEQMHGQWQLAAAMDLHSSRDVAVPQLVVEDVLTELEAAVALSDECRNEGDRLLLHLRRDVAPFASSLIRHGGDELSLLRTLADGPILRAAGTGTKAAWSGEGIEAVRRHLANATKLVDDLLLGPRRRSLQLVLEVARQIVVDAADARRVAGELEHHDTLVLALEALDHQAVRDDYQHRWRFLFVDEVQDVDPLQVRLIQAIGKPFGDADHQVTLVGDLRQSIYRFRGADAVAAQELRSWAEAQVLALPANHRSAPKVVSWIDSLFGRFDEQWRTSTPTRTDVSGRLSVVGLGQKQTSDEARNKTCTDLLAWITSERNHGIAFRDIAILMPGRRSLQSIEHALQRARLPYRVEAQSLLWDTDEVRDVLAIVAALCRPDDAVAVVGALRTPMLGCGDDELLSWVSMGNNFVDPPGNPIPGLVHSGLSMLGEWRNITELLRPDEVVTDVIARSGAFEKAAARPRRREAWSRLRFLERRARAWAQQFDEELDQFVTWAHEQRSERVAAYDQALPDPDDDAIRVMTIHASKGLEFRAVGVVGLEAARAAPPSARLLWEGAIPALRLGPADIGWQTPSFEQHGANDDGAARAELRRLAYVGFTRARDSLFVSLHHRDASDCLARVLANALGVPEEVIAGIRS